MDNNIDVKYPSLPPQYDIEAQLGSGAAGIVLRAKEKMTERAVAIKVLSDGKSSTSEERFHREAKLLARLEHGHIVRIFHSGISNDGSYYHVMELLEGESLSQKLKENPTISREIFFDLFEQMFSALEYAHSFGIVHRDIKPSNIMLSNETLEEAKCNAKLVDFGIGKEFHDEGSEESRGLTGTGMLLGTPLYMSPEQCRGAKASTQSDIYSLGCVMYECLTGKPPFKGANAMETMRCHLHDPVPPIVLAESEQELANLILRCLDKDPARRPTAANALNELERIETALNGQLSKRSRSIFDYSPYAIAIIMTFVLLIGTVYLLDRANKPPEGPRSVNNIHRQTNESDVERKRTELKTKIQKMERGLRTLSEIEQKSIRSAIAEQKRDLAEHQKTNEPKDLEGAQKNYEDILKLIPKSNFKTNSGIGIRTYYELGELHYYKGNKNTDPQEFKLASNLYNKAVRVAKMNASTEIQLLDALAARARFKRNVKDYAAFKNDIKECIGIANKYNSPSQEVALSKKVGAVIDGITDDLKTPAQGAPILLNSQDPDELKQTLEGVNLVAAFLPAGSTKRIEAANLQEALLDKLIQIKKDSKDFKSLEQETRTLIAGAKGS
ncbi:MAG: serine/threonine protein kinase [Candidatus Obscuribacterales bacterium]|nr:serine/threonine protein kinase [Candidatus Obscuribacterales bacterium]